MYVNACKIKLRISYALTLKDKRQVLRSIVAKCKNKFNVSISEIEELNNIKMIVLGLAVVSNNSNLSQKMMNEIINYIESNFDIELIDIEIYE